MGRMAEWTVSSVGRSVAWADIPRGTREERERNEGCRWCGRGPATLRYVERAPARRDRHTGQTCVARRRVGDDNRPSHVMPHLPSGIGASTRDGRASDEVARFAADVVVAGLATAPKRSCWILDLLTFRFCVHGPDVDSDLSEQGPATGARRFATDVPPPFLYRPYGRLASDEKEPMDLRRDARGGDTGSVDAELRAELW
jgi:hypothetical protein